MSGMSNFLEAIYGLSAQCDYAVERLHGALHGIADPVAQENMQDWELRELADLAARVIRELQKQHVEDIETIRRLTTTVLELH